MNVIKKRIIIYTCLCVSLSGCIESTYIRPLVSETEPHIIIPAENEIRRIARESSDPVATLIAAKHLPRYQVIQYACQQAMELPDRLNMEWNLLCAQRIVDLIKNQQEVLRGGQALQLLYGEAASRIFRFVRDQSDNSAEVLFEDRNFVIYKRSDSDDVRGFTELLESDHYQLSQFDHRYSRAGFGVPFVGFQENRLAEPIDALYPPEGRSYAYTGIVDFAPEPGRGRYVAKLHLLDPASQYVAFGRCEYPLAGDFSAPYAYLLSLSPLRQLAWSGFFEFERTQDHLGLFLMQPYDPEKIPIVMVHGLLSSPREWTQLTNTVFGTELARRYQVWHYVYPTSAPFLYSAKILRQKLEQARVLLDPELDDFATKHIVFVAHSMGGLLTKALAVNSESRLWDAAFLTPVDELKLSPTDREELRSIFFLEPESYVKRIVFLGTPHHGSEFAHSFVGGLGSTVSRRPVAMKSLLIRVTTDNPYCMTDEMKGILTRGGPTSVQGLAPDHPLIGAFASIPVTPNTPFNTIIGSGSGTSNAEISDGIVTYASAHLEGAESEFVVPVRHSKYDEPEVVATIVDILQLHLDHIDRPPDRF
jgi:hypothetical protein